MKHNELKKMMDNEMEKFHNKLEHLMGTNPSLIQLHNYAMDCLADAIYNVIEIYEKRIQNMKSTLRAQQKQLDRYKMQDLGKRIKYLLVRCENNLSRETELLQIENRNLRAQVKMQTACLEFIYNRDKAEYDKLHGEDKKPEEKGTREPTWEDWVLTFGGDL